jgi:oligopeptide/dipeptide ABC transporter ATP-binding protein
MANNLLEITGLTTTFTSFSGTVTAVDGLDLHIGKGEIVSLVGESGCGKSVTGLSIMGLIPSPPGAVTGGTVLFKGTDLRQLPEKRLRRIRGNEIAMIFQEPMTSLNPVYTIGNQILEAILLHETISRRAARARVLDLLKTVAIPDPAQRFTAYPHQLSGGMRQRAMIAMALACNPDLLIADEPTTALDVTIQAQILDLLLKLRLQFGLSILLITHDLGIVAETAGRVAVMYAGKLVETASVTDLFTDPLHPYTQGLLQSARHMMTDDTVEVPVTDSSNGPIQKRAREKLPVIEGSVPSLADLPPGCAFSPRCRHATDECRRPGAVKTLTEPRPGRFVRCILYGSGQP